MVSDMTNFFTVVAFPFGWINPSSSATSSSTSSTTITSASSTSGATISNCHLAELCSQLVN
jgi:hypothetical protein